MSDVSRRHHGSGFRRESGVGAPDRRRAPTARIRHACRSTRSYGLLHLRSRLARANSSLIEEAWESAVQTVSRDRGLRTASLR